MLSYSTSCKKPVYFNVIRGIRRDDVVGAHYVQCCKEYGLFEIDLSVNWFRWVRDVIKSSALKRVERIPFGTTTTYTLVRHLVKEGWVIVHATLYSGIDEVRQEILNQLVKEPTLFSRVRRVTLRNGECAVIFDTLASAIGICDFNERCMKTLTELCRMRWCR